MPHPGLPPMQDAGDAINAFSGREPGGGGLAMAGGPPAAGLAAGPDPGDVEFGESEEMGLSNLADLHRDAMRESARQGRRDTRESRRERRRLDSRHRRRRDAGGDGAAAIRHSGPGGRRYVCWTGNNGPRNVRCKGSYGGCTAHDA